MYNVRIERRRIILKKKITYIVGIAASLWVANVLNRVGGFLLYFRRLTSIPLDFSMFLAAFITSLICPLLFIRAWRGKLSNWGKWIGVTASFLGFIYMMTKLKVYYAGVATATVSFLLVSVCLIISDTRDNDEELSIPGRIIFWIELATLIVFIVVFLPEVLLYYPIIRKGSEK